MKDNTKKIVGAGQGVSAGQSAREKYSFMMETMKKYDSLAARGYGRMAAKQITRAFPATLRVWDERNQNIGTDKHSYIDKGNTKPEYPKYEK